MHSYDVYDCLLPSSMTIFSPHRHARAYTHIQIPHKEWQTGNWFYKCFYFFSSGYYCDCCCSNLAESVCRHVQAFWNLMYIQWNIFLSFIRFQFIFPAFLYDSDSMLIFFCFVRASISLLSSSSSSSYTQILTKPNSEFKYVDAKPARTNFGLFFVFYPVVVCNIVQIVRKEKVEDNMRIVYKGDSHFPVVLPVTIFFSVNCFYNLNFTYSSLDLFVDALPFGHITVILI